MLRYGVYARKSSEDESITEKSIGEQLAAISQMVERDKLWIVWRHDESKSAKIPRCRPIYSELIALVEKGQVDAILCWHINRLVRNMEEGGKLAQLVVDGVIKEIRTPHAVYRAGDNIMPLVIEAAMATQYVVDLARDVRRAQANSFRQGATLHRAPQGYMNTRDPLNLKRGVVVKDPERFPLIRKAWDLLLTESYTPGEVLRTLNEEWGYRTRPTKRGGRQPLSPSCVYKMFRNPYYAGFVCMQGELGTGKHEPMVSMGEFAKAKEILKKHMKQAAQHHRFTYTGLMRCGYCGQQITAEAKILRNGDRWDTYHCADSRLRCTKRGLSHQKLEEKFVAALCRFAVDPDLVGEAERVIVEELETRETKRGDLVHQQQSALRSAEERIRKIEEMWIGGLITDASRYRDLVRVEIQAKNRSLQALEEANQEFSEMKANARAACAYLLLDFRSFRDRSDHQKREMVGALADVTFYGKDKRIRARIPKVLSEVIRFVNSLAMLLEPADLRSGTQKEPTYERSILFGGPEGVTIEPKEALKKPNGSGRRNGKRRCTNGIHVPDSLFAALAGPRFSGAVPPLKKQGRTGRVRLGKPLSVFLERDLVSLAGLGSGTSLVDGVIHEVEEADNPLEDLTGLTHG